jgi:hypothetical protein
MAIATPAAPDTYSRRMSTLFDENTLIGVPTGGLSWFAEPNGRTLYESDATVVEYDIVRGTDTVAPLILRGSDATATDSNSGVNMGKSTNSQRVFPLIEDFGVISHSQITRRMAGEPSHGGLKQEQRMRALAAEANREVVRRVVRKMEIMAWESILTGKMSAITGTAENDLLYDFRRNPAHAVNGTNWTNSSTPKLANLDTWWNLIRTNSFDTSNVLLCGDTVISSLFNDDEIQGFADNRRYGLMDMGVNPLQNSKLQRISDNGFDYACTIKTTVNHEFHCFTYQGRHSGGTRLLPIDKMVMTNADVLTERQFGPGDRLPPSQQEIQDYRQYMGIDINSMPQNLNIQFGTQNFDPRWFTFGFKRFDKSFKAITQVAPIFVPKRTDSWLVATIT